MTSEHKHFPLDRLGITISFLCLIHCLVPPLLIVAFPLISALGSYDSVIHVTLTLLVVPVAYKAILQGYRHHQKKRVVASAGLGIFLFLSGSVIVIFFHHEHGHDEVHLWDQLELASTGLGSLFLSAGHAMNMWYCRRQSKS